MPKAPGTFSANERISHTAYGLGTISHVDERHTTIVFDENGTRKFLTDVVKLERSDVPAPARPARSRAAKKAKSGK